MQDSLQYLVRQGKIPVSHVTGMPVDPFDRQHWLPQNVAESIASQWGPCYSIGYSLSPDDPYFLLDIDHCVDVNGQWSSLALDMQRRLTGCYMERSQSGTGMHIIGRTCPVAHSCRHTALGIELYTAQRFISLTGTEAIGNADTDASAALAPVIAEYFPPKPTENDVAWTTEPVPGYTSTHSDQELVELALKPRPRDVFGGHLAFSDLWQGKFTDHSAADLQLCNHLAFWTGGNCQRIERLFGESGLVRPKWDDREDYRIRTILAAVSACESYFTVQKPQQATCLGFRAEVSFPELKSNGRPKATVENLRHLLNTFDVVCRHNEMNHDDEILIPGMDVPMGLEYRTATGHVLSMCASADLPSTGMNEFLDIFCASNHYHPARDWIDSLPWDGFDRIPQLAHSLNADNPMAAAVLVRRWLLSAIAALYNPKGVNTGGMLVIQGPQGIGKTQWFKSLAGQNDDLVKDGSILNMNFRDSIIQNLDHWLVELGELDASLKKSEIAQLKAFITKGTDSFREAYARRAAKYPRRTVYMGTVNKKDYLKDETGNRRFWTIGCNNKINFNHQISMQQIWAQVLSIYKTGESHHLTPTEDLILATINEQHRPQTIVEQMVRSFYNLEGPRTREVTTAEILKEIGYPLPMKNDRRPCYAIAAALGVEGPYLNSRKNAVFKMPAIAIFTATDGTDGKR